MPIYVPPLVAFLNTYQRMEGSGGLQGVPTSFRYLLISYWVCLGTDLQSRDITFDSGSFIFTTATQPISGSNSIFVELRNNNNGPYWWDGYFGHNWNGLVTNVLLSVDSVAGVVQCYANDVACPVLSGGLTGQPLGMTNITPFWTGYTWEGTAIPPGSGLGDFFLATPAAFFDLTVTANRRKFINADLSPVDPGVTGNGPLGVSPPFYLTARSGVADDFGNNNGTGGTLTLINAPFGLQTPGFCNVAWPPEVLAKTLTDSELFFAPTGGFVDFTSAPNRRLFIAGTGTPQWMERDGSLPFGASPPVYLTTLGPPNDFAQNNGNGGTFTIFGTLDPTAGPGCSPYFITEATGPASVPQWRLSYSDDGARTWSRLVKPRDIGQTGHYLQRLRWLKMGQSRERVVKLECTDPVRRNIVGIYIDAGPGLE